MSLLTRYPLGVLRVIPFPVHGAIELVTSIGLVALPWLGGFEGQPMSRGLFLGAGLSLFTSWCITDYRGAESRTNAGRIFPRRHEDRRAIWRKS